MRGRDGFPPIFKTNQTPGPGKCNNKYIQIR